MVNIELLTEKNFVESSLDSYERRQEVNKVYRKKEGEYVLVEQVSAECRGTGVGRNLIFDTPFLFLNFTGQFKSLFCGNHSNNLIDDCGSSNCTLYNLCKLWSR